MTLITYPEPLDITSWIQWFENVSVGNLKEEVLHSTRLLTSKHEKKKFAGVKNRKHKR